MKGKIVGVVFFGFFLALGGGFTWLGFVRPAMKIVAARQWVETPCRIVSSSVSSHEGSKGGTTFRVEISYMFHVDGHEYQSSRYGFSDMTSSGRERKAAIVNRYPPGSAAVCYVNPRDPNDAVLERWFTTDFWFVLIPLVFVLIGLGGLIYTVKAGKAAVPTAPGAPPWQHRPDWAAGSIRSSTKPAMIGAWVFAALWNTVSMPLLFLLPGEVFKKHNYPAAIGFLFPVVGVGLLVWAVRATMRWRRFGESVFEMDPVPGVIGGAVAGRVRLGRWLQPADGFKVKLSCINRVVTGGGKNRSTRESVLWQDEQTVSGSADTIPVEFCIPPDCRESSDENPNARVIWRLETAARVPGVDYAAQFEVPVFKVAQTPEQVAVAERARAAEREAVDRYQRPATSRIRVQPAMSGGTEFYFPAARNPGTATGLTAFFVIWTAAIWLQVFLKAPLLFPVVTGLVDLFLLYWVLDLWFGTSRVVVSPEAVVVSAGMIRAKRTIPVTDIARITTKVGMTAGNKVYRDVKIVLRNGREVTAGSSVADPLEAEWLAAEMSQAAGLRRS